MSDTAALLGGQRAGTETTWLSVRRGGDWLGPRCSRRSEALPQPWGPGRWPLFCGGSRRGDRRHVSAYWCAVTAVVWGVARLAETSSRTWAWRDFSAWSACPPPLSYDSRTSPIRLCPACGKRRALLMRKYFPVWKIVVTFLFNNLTVQSVDRRLGPRRWVRGEEGSCDG